MHLLNTNEWLRETANLSPYEKSILFDLLFYYGQKGSLPTEISRLAVVVREPEERFIIAWPKIKRHFNHILSKRKKTSWIVPPKHENTYFDIEERPGVYAIRIFLDDNQTRMPIVYVGEAKNLKNRLNGHEIDKLLGQNNLKSCCKIKYCDNRLELETALIKKIKPVFNMRHNKEFVKKIYVDHVVGELHKKVMKSLENMISFSRKD